MPAELRTRLHADLAYQRATGTLWLLIAVCLAVAITAYFGWLGLHRTHAAPTWVPMLLSALVGLAGIVAAAVVGRRRRVWVETALALPQVAVVDGVLQHTVILPQQERFARLPRSYALQGVLHSVLEESPGTEALSGFVPQHVVGPAPGTPLRLVWSAAHPGHLLQVDYPGMAAEVQAPAPMDAQDWRDLTARPRAALRAVAWLCGVLLLGIAALAAVPAIGAGVRLWLWAGVGVALLWLLCVWAPAARLWLRRGQVRRHTLSGPVQEVMLARRNDGLQGVEHALFARLGGAWHLLHTAGKASALHTTLVPGAALTVSYAVLGEHRIGLRHSAAMA